MYAQCNKRKKRPENPVLAVPDHEAAECQSFYHRPKMSKEECDQLLRHRPAGTFIVRDSASMMGGFGLMMKVIEDGMCVMRSYLLEPLPDGIHLRLTDEPSFATLHSFCTSHVTDRMALPSPLVLPTHDWMGEIDPKWASTQFISADIALPDEPKNPPPPSLEPKPLPRRPRSVGPGGGPPPPRLQPKPSLPSSMSASPPSPSRLPSEPTPPALPQKPQQDGRKSPIAPMKSFEIPPALPAKPTTSLDITAAISSSEPASTSSRTTPSSPNLDLQRRESTQFAVMEDDEIECEVHYFGSLETWAERPIEGLFQTYLELVEIRTVVPNKVLFKMAGAGITIQDKSSKNFVRKHYPIRTVEYFSMDPDEHTFKAKKEKELLSIFGMLVKKPGQDKRTCHLFAARHVLSSSIIDSVTSAMENARLH